MDIRDPPYGAIDSPVLRLHGRALGVSDRPAPREPMTKPFLSRDFHLSDRRRQMKKGASLSNRARVFGRGEARKKSQRETGQSPRTGEIYQRPTESTRAPGSAPSPKQRRLRVSRLDCKAKNRRKAGPAADKLVSWHALPRRNIRLDAGRAGLCTLNIINSRGTSSSRTD